MPDVGMLILVRPTSFFPRSPRSVTAFSGVTRQTTDLFRMCRYRVTVIRVATERQCTHNQTAAGLRYRALVPELVLLVLLTLRYALNLRFMKAVHLIFIVALLVNHPHRLLPLSLPSRMIHEANLLFQSIQFTSVSPAKRNALFPGHLQHLGDDLPVQLRIRMERDVLLLHRAVYHHQLHLLRRNLLYVHHQADLENLLRPISPIRFRNFVMSIGFIGGRLWNTFSPVKYCMYGFSIQRATTPSSLRL